MLVLDEEELESASEALCEALDRFSPQVEPGPLGSGAFWIDPAGMARLYGPPAVWAAAIRDHLAEIGWRSTVVVGFRRFLTRALAEFSAELRVFERPEDEVEAAAEVPLRGLDLPRRRVSALASIQVDTLGDLLRLPAAELRSRFGAEIAKLHVEASGARWDPLRPRLRREPIVASLVFEPPEEVDDRLLFAMKGALPQLLARLDQAGERARALLLHLDLGDAEALDLRVELATPTTDLLQIVDLLRLRLSALPLPAPVVELGLTLEGTRPSRPQIDLLAERERRDPRLAERALDRIRAAYGEASVTRASLREAHLPEASFAWEPTHSVRQPRTSELPANLSGASSCLVRRLLRRPIPLAASPSEDRFQGADDPPRMPSLVGVMPPTCGAIRRLHGPHRISGGWWVRPVERDYYYAETTGDELLWLFYDRPRRRWFLHGVVD